MVGTVDVGGDLALSPGFLWANSDDCSGDFDTTAVLAQAQSVSVGGRVALVTGPAEALIDALQSSGEQSVATALPVPAAAVSLTGADGFGPFIDVSLSWSAPASTMWAVSTALDPLAGFGVYVTSAGAMTTGDKSQFTRVGATPSGTEPFVTDDPDAEDGWLPASATTTTVRIRPGGSYAFAVSLVFDGTGAAGPDPQVDASAVETSEVSATSDVVVGSDVLFADDFESGTTDAWDGVEG